jgi:hypothetical protein
MHLIQLLLPVYDNSGRRFPPAHHKAVKEELAQRFGGLTAYTQAPAEGLWSDNQGVQTRDDIIVYEVMTDVVDPDWWRAFRERLELQFEQREVVVRAHAVTKL